MDKKIGRNDPCPCGSGKKYKNCCLAKDRARRLCDSAWRQDEQLVLDQLLDFARRPDFDYQFVVAFNLFWNGNYGTEGLGVLGRHEVSRFLDWYIYDYRLEEKRKRLIDLFLEELGSDLSPREQECAQSWQNSYLSLYRIAGPLEEETLPVVDVLQEIPERILADGVTVHGLHGDLVVGRLLRSSTMPHFSWAAILLPAAMEGELSIFMKEGYKDYQQTYPQATWPEYLSIHGYMFNHYLLRSAATAGKLQQASKMYYDAYGTLERLREAERKLQEKRAMAAERLLPGYVHYKGSKEVR